MRYRKRPLLIEATQWFKNGDHPQDETVPVKLTSGAEGISEGKVVRYFRSLKIPGGRICPKCGNVMQKHGLLEKVVGEEAMGDEDVICPGDYIITHQNGGYYKLTAKDFETMYEPYIPTPRDQGLAG